MTAECPRDGRPIHHHPWLYRTSHYGCWASCDCGWETDRPWTTVVGAHLEFGRHLVEANR